MPTITSGIAYCSQCGRPRPADGNAHCPACQPATAPPPSPRPVPPPYAPAAEPPAPPARRSLFDLLLDPRSIHWLLVSGGVLLAAGLVVWLASLGLFQNPVIVAAAMATGTMGLLATGWSTIRFTRYQLAGRAMTLLACLVMPLNLWFYQANNLITLEGHLWLAGVVCCALYAASAWRLKDPLFVYVLNAGVAMTGLLMLADMGRFTEIAAPSTLLVVLGLIALHVERIFPLATTEPTAGAFTRQRFGRAFFWSAQALLASGLVLLLGAQIAGWLTFPILQSVFHVVRPEIVTNPLLKGWALALVAAGTYAYIYSDLVVRRVGTYLYIAAGTVLWGEVLAIDLFHLSAQPAALIIALSLTALGANVLQAYLSRRFLNREINAAGLPISIPGAHLAILNILPVALGTALYFRATFPLINHLWPTTINLAYGIAMLIAAACCRIGAHLSRTTTPRTATANLFASAAAALTGSAALLAVFGLATPAGRAPILMLIPIGYAVSAHVRRNALSDTLVRVAQATAGLLVAAALLTSTRQLLPTIFGPGTRPIAATLQAIFYLEAAAFYTLAATLRRGPGNVYLATGAAAAAIWQLLIAANASTTASTVAFAALGLTMLTALKFLFSHDPRGSAQTSPLHLAALRCANAVTSLSFLSAALLTLSHLVGKPAGMDAVFHLAALAGMSLLASLLAGHTGWRRVYVVAAVAQGALAGVAFQRLMNWTPWQRAEHLSVLVGSFLLALGHLGWHREQGRPNRSDTVTTQLILGSLLAGLPLAIAAITFRIGGEISLANEFALVTVGILLLVTGNICRIRSTTLTGGTLLAAQFIMMLVSLGVRAQLAMGVYLTLGGAAIFTTGLLLSIHRDRLATLPDRIKARQGVFKVLSWR